MALALDEQLTLRELLKDPIYREWFKKQPGDEILCTSGKPWRVWVQRKRKGRWGRADFATYREAYTFLKQFLLDGCYDAALGNKVKQFRPPVVRDKATKKKRYAIPRVVGMNPQHEWCPHCRRPTIFTTFSKHHAMRRLYDSVSRRCAICGIRLVAVRRYQ